MRKSQERIAILVCLSAFVASSAISQDVDGQIFIAKADAPERAKADSAVSESIEELQIDRSAVAGRFGKAISVPDDLFYTESHEWVRREGKNARVGITDHAQAELTEVVYVELPKVGAQAEAGGQIAVVQSVPEARDVRAPIKGTIVEVNKALEANPALINKNPFGEGWIFVLKMDSVDDLKNLKDAAAYKEQIR